MSVDELYCMNGNEDLYLDPDRQWGFCKLRLNRNLITTLEKPNNSGSNIIETEDSLIVPFRMLSKTLIEGHWIDFTRDGVLESAVGKFNTVTIYSDHSTSVRNWVGVAINARFVSGNPDGINADFKIDKIKEPMIVRGLKLEPPAIHSCSVGIGFDYEKSHPEFKSWEFHNRLGEEFNGSIVRRIVTKITDVDEVSLVYAGADPNAKKLFKGWSLKDMDIDKDKLNKVLLFFGLDSSIDFNSNLESISKVLTTLQSENKRLESAVKELETQLESGKKFIELGKANEREIREQSLKNYRAFAMENADEKIVQLLEKGEIETVRSLGLDYKQRLEERFRLNANGVRQSSVGVSADGVSAVVDFDSFRV